VGKPIAFPPSPNDGTNGLPTGVTVVSTLAFSAGAPIKLSPPLLLPPPSSSFSSPPVALRPEDPPAAALLALEMAPTRPPSLFQGIEEERKEGRKEGGREGRVRTFESEWVDTGTALSNPPCLCPSTTSIYSSLTPSLTPSLPLLGDILALSQTSRHRPVRAFKPKIVVLPLPVEKKKEERGGKKRATRKEGKEGKEGREEGGKKAGKGRGKEGQFTHPLRPCVGFEELQFAVFPFRGLSLHHLQEVHRLVMHREKGRRKVGFRRPYWQITHLVSIDLAHIAALPSCLLALILPPPPSLPPYMVLLFPHGKGC